MDPKTTAAKSSPDTPTGEVLPDVWEPPFDRWLRLTDLFIDPPATAARPGVSSSKV